MFRMFLGITALLGADESQEPPRQSKLIPPHLYVLHSPFNSCIYKACQKALWMKRVEILAQKNLKKIEEPLGSQNLPNEGLFIKKKSKVSRLQSLKEEHSLFSEILEKKEESVIPEAPQLENVPSEEAVLSSPRNVFKEPPEEGVVIDLKDVVLFDEGSIEFEDLIEITPGDSPEIIALQKAPLSLWGRMRRGIGW